MRISEGGNRIKAIHTFKEYETDVVIISTSDKVTCSLIQEVSRAGFTWHEYAWIILEVSLRLNMDRCTGEGVILLTEQMAFKNAHERCRAEIILNLSTSLFSGTFRDFRENKLLINISVA